MSVKIRLTRTGSKHNPHYRLVATDSRAPRDGRFLEILGHFDPKRYPESVTIHVDKLNAWIDKGAQPSATVRKLLGSQGLLKQQQPQPAAAAE